VQRIFLYIITFCFFLIACSKDKSEQYERFYIRFDGADLAVQVEGNIASNIFILVLHGGPGSNGLAYNISKYSDILESEYAMVYLDQRGHGASQGKYGEKRVTLLQLAKDAEEVVKTLKLKYGTESKVFLMGHSWGGLIGTKALIDTDIQNYISGWIEADGAHDIPKLNRDLVKMFRFYAEEQISKGNDIEFWQSEVLKLINEIDTNNITFVQSLAMNKLAYRAEAKIPEVNKPEKYAVDKFSLSKSPYGIMSIISSNFTAIAISNETESASLTDKLYKIHLPTLLIWGKYDFVTPPSLGQDAYDLISSDVKYFHILNNSGHSTMIYEPIKFTTLIKEFIEESL
jgi:pimeloyl-ACP methyl ester carboxylesterase